MFKHGKVIFIAAATLLSIVFAQAEEEQQSKFALPLSASFGLGPMEGDYQNANSRMMDTFSIEALPSYRFGKWLVGPHMDFKIVNQISSLSNSGGTNLKGNGWSVGLGIRHDFNPRFFLQGAIDFIGAYDLEKILQQMKTIV